MTSCRITSGIICSTPMSIFFATLIAKTHVPQLFFVCINGQIEADLHSRIWHLIKTGQALTITHKTDCCPSKHSSNELRAR